MRKRAVMTTMLAGWLAPGLAAAGAIAPLAGPSLHPARVVNVRQLAALEAKLGPVHAAAVAMRPHRYPTPDGKPRAVSLLRLPGANTLVTTGVVPRSQAGFNGTYAGADGRALGGNVFEPPDQGLAVNNGTAVEDINDALEIFSPSGKPTSIVSNFRFFGVPSTDGVGDPHVEFDSSTQRWFVDTYYTNASGFNGFLLAVSQTSDPAGSYYVYQIDDMGSQVPFCHGSCFGDYPQPGYDANAYYIDADLFSNVTGGFSGAAIYALPKAALIAGGTFSYDMYAVPAFVVEPAIPAAPGHFAIEANGTEYFLTARNIFDGSTKLEVFSLSNTGLVGTSTPPVLLSTQFQAEAYTGTVPSTQPDMVGPYGQSVGATAAPQLDGGYNSFGSGVKYLKGALYGALATGTTDSNGLARDVVAWFKVNVATNGTGLTANVGAQGYIVPPDGYSITYPGITLDVTGKGIIGMTITNPDATVPGGYPSAGFVAFENDHPLPTFYVSGQGSASDDGFTGYSGSQATVGRWGDFSTATIDPVTGIFYVGNEYIPDATLYPRSVYANWGTFITKVK